MTKMFKLHRCIIKNITKLLEKNLIKYKSDFFLYALYTRCTLTHLNT